MQTNGVIMVRVVTFLKHAWNG